VGVDVRPLWPGENVPDPGPALVRDHGEVPRAGGEAVRARRAKLHAFVEWAAYR